LESIHAFFFGKYL
jgi:hypothetical protein